MTLASKKMDGSEVDDNDGLREIVGTEGVEGRPSPTPGLITWDGT